MTSVAVFTTTWAVSHPPVGDAGVRTVTADPETPRMVPGRPPKSTSETPPRLAPLSVTTLPPLDGPEPRFIPVTAGQAFTGATRSGMSEEAMGDPSPVA